MYEYTLSAFLFYLLTFHMSLANPPKYKITYLNNHAGLYYNHIGDAKISNSRFTLLTHFNISIIEQKFEQIRRYFKNSEEMCTHKGTSYDYNHVVFYCQNSMELIHSHIKKLDEKLETINHLTGHNLPLARSKRGLVDGGSYIIHWLFGTPDADDAKYYDNSIKTLINDNRNTQLLMKQQIAVTTNAIQNFNASFHTLKLNEDKLNNNIILFNKFSNETISTLNQLKLKQVVTEQISLLSQLTEELDDYCDLLISSVTLAKHNILHPQVITPLNLLHELNSLILQNGQKLPFDLSYSTIHKYFEISKLEVMYVNSVIVFAIKIPLVEEPPYILYEILPLPISHNDTNSLYSYIDPSFPYLLISTTKVYYAELHNLNKCLLIGEMDYICHQTHVVRTSEKPTCETTFLTSPIKRIPANCKTHTVQANMEIWHPLPNNEWLFTITQPRQLTLTCDASIIEDVNISTTGIIKISPHCKGYTQSYVLDTSEETTKNHTHKIPEISIPLDDCCYSKEPYESTKPLQLQPVKLTNIKLDELKYANHKLKQLDDLIQDELNRTKETPRSNTWSLIGSATLAVIIIFILYIALRYCGLIRLIRSLLCCNRQSSDKCCLKIFNTNVNGPPITRRQLTKLLAEEEEREREIEMESRLPILTSPTTRRSASREASIIMD